MAEINYSALKSFDGVVSEAEFNALVDAIQSTTVCNGVGYRLKRTPVGTTIVTGSTGTGGTTPPFHLVLIKSGDAYNGLVYPGKVNELVPPNILTSGALSPFTVPSDAGSVCYMYCQCTTNGQQVTNAAITFDTTAPVAIPVAQGAITTSFNVYLYTIIFPSTGAPVTYRTFPEGNIIATPVQWMITSPSSPAAPGQSPYSIWYGINLTSDAPVSVFA